LFPLLVSAYSDTLPVVAWSSHRSSVLDGLPLTLTKSSSSSSIVQGIVFSDEICDHDVVVLVDQPGLHASDLRSLHPSSSLAKRLGAAPSSVQLAYTQFSPVSAVPFFDLAESISRRCSSRIINITPGRGDFHITSGFKHVVCLTMDSLHNNLGSRKAHMFEQESRLADELDILTSTFPKHLIVYSASYSENLLRRQVDPGSDLGATHVDAYTSPFAAPNSTLPEGGILKRYQLLTPALIMSLLVVFFVLIPVVVIGFEALSSIQSPLRAEPPKAFNARERKNQ